MNEKRDGVNANENPANGGEVDKVETMKSKNINKDQKDEILKKNNENLDYGPTLEGGGISALPPPLGCVDSVKNTSMILNLEEDKLPRNNLVKEKLKISDKMTAVNGPSNEHFLMFLKNLIEDNEKVKFISDKRVGEENPMLKTKSTDQDMSDIVIYLENISDDPKIEGPNKEQIDMVDANTVTHDENGKQNKSENDLKDALSVKEKNDDKEEK